MSKEKSDLECRQEESKIKIAEANTFIEELGKRDNELSEILNAIQNRVEKIRNSPIERNQQYEKVKKIHSYWNQKVLNIQTKYEKSMNTNAKTGASAVGLGVGVAALGPSVAMGIATTFGVASTGTAISALSGAAATNAALAWLGGGALVAGGGGMGAGTVFLALAGPAGLAIAAAAFATFVSSWFSSKKRKEHLENIFIRILDRDIESYNSAISKIKKRTEEIQDITERLEEALRIIKTFGENYDEMNEIQREYLGKGVNLMLEATVKLVDPIGYLLPRYSEPDFKKYEGLKGKIFEENIKNLIISLANLLYGIKLDDKDDREYLLDWLKDKDNKEFLNSLGVTKDDLDLSIIETTEDALSYKYYETMKA
jgi:prefoldin subunit 5